MIAKNSTKTSHNGKNRNSKQPDISSSVRDENAETNELGERIRNIRKSRGLSIRELAAQASISVNMLSLIENGKTSPSVHTLQRIARALQVVMATFFQPVKDEKDIVYTKADSRPRAMMKVALVEYLSKDLAGSIVDALVVSMHPKMNSGKVPIVHAGYEFVYCLKGKILYTIEEEHFLLEPGDSIAFEATHEHQWQNLDSEESQFLLVVINLKNTETSAQAMHNY